MRGEEHHPDRGAQRLRVQVHPEQVRIHPRCRDFHLQMAPEWLWGLSLAQEARHNVLPLPGCLLSVSVEGQISFCFSWEEQGAPPSPRPSCCLCRACLGQCFSYSVPNTFPQSTESLVHCDSCMPAQSMWEIVSIPAASTRLPAGPRAGALSSALPPLQGESFSFPEVFPLVVSFQGVSQVTVTCLEMPGWKGLLEAT